jgi:spermidine synthase
MRRLTEKQTHAYDPVLVSEQRGLRTLHFAGGVAQSVMRVRDPVALELEYTRAAMLFAVLHPAPHAVALIGLGGGSLAKFIHHHLPNAHLTALEINPEVVAAARSYFFLPPNDARLTTITGDGAAWMAAQQGTQDALILDGYDRKRIVAALSSAEFYRHCHEALRPGGWAVFNLWAEEGRFHLYREAIETAFGRPAKVLSTEQKGNLLVFAQRQPAPTADPAEVIARARDLTTWGFDVTTLAARLFA